MINYIKQFGLTIFIYSLLDKILSKFHLDTLSLFFNRVKHFYIEKKIISLIPIVNDINIIDTKFSPKIWIFWWQGISEAPLLIKKCVTSIENHASKYDVIVIDRNNWSEYIVLPDVILHKFNEGNISLTHLSDIIRFQLLYKYGGFWLDATVYVSQEIPIMQTSYWTTRNTPQREVLCVSKARWNGAIMYCSKNHPFADFMNKCFINYWSKYNCLIDYFLIDYFTDIAYNNLLFFKNLLNSLPDDNLLCFELDKNMNKPVEYLEECQILELSVFHKLQRRTKYNTLTSTGKETIYSYIFS